VFVGGHVALLLTYLWVALPIDGVVAVLVPLGLLGAFYAATDGVLAAIAGHLASPGVRASAIASAQTVVVAARFVASTAFGLLWFTLGPHRALLTVAALLLLVIPVTCLVVRDLERKPATA
jgi:hypothetical protein